MHSLLCVDRGIPISSVLLDGNESDKNINRNLIPEMVQRMKTLGRSDFIFVADSAAVTQETLKRIDDWEGGFLFVSRLPMTYNECGAAINRAIKAGAWIEIGSISPEPVTKNRKPLHIKLLKPPSPCTAPSIEPW
ncbi:MAG: hypothetical protein FJY85_07050 [Deltaproteobacteria bacterium]|nr:hypothetical protein [Deltaproteobacteria bacterium]